MMKNVEKGVIVINRGDMKYKSSILYIRIYRKNLFLGFENMCKDAFTPERRASVYF